MSPRSRTIAAVVGLVVVFGALALSLGLYAASRGSLAGKAQLTTSDIAWVSGDPEGPIIEVRPIRVVDGDTAIFEFEDCTLAKVRMIGINCPETNGRFIDYYTKKPLDFAAAELQKYKHVYLEMGAHERDSHGQLLAYVWLKRPSAEPSESDVRANQLNAKMLLAGYAKRATSASLTGTETSTPAEGTPVNKRYSALYKLYLEEAQTGRRGFWDPGVATVVGTPSGFFTTSDSPKPTTVYVGNKVTRRFHRAECVNAVAMRKARRVMLQSRDSAFELGFVPCKICKP